VDEGSNEEFKLSEADDDLEDSLGREEGGYTNLLLTMKTGADADVNSFGSVDFDMTNELNTTGQDLTGYNSAPH